LEQIERELEGTRQELLQKAEAADAAIATQKERNCPRGCVSKSSAKKSF